MVKVPDKIAPALDVIEGMDDVLFDAEMFAKLLDYLISQGFDEHRDGYYNIPQREGDLITFVSLKAVTAVRACQDQLGDLDPRNVRQEVSQ